MRYTTRHSPIRTDAPVLRINAGAGGRIASVEHLDRAKRVTRIASVLTANSLTLLHFIAARSRALLAEAGAEIVEESGSWDGFSASHVFGTCRMGADSATSVVDARGRAHDHDNLWIADASVFASSGGGESPALTISALAVRTAAALLG